MCADASLNAYRRSYWQFRLSISQCQLISLGASGSLVGFPDCKLIRVDEELAAGLSALISALKTTGHKTTPNPAGPVAVTVGPVGPIGVAATSYLVAKFNLDEQDLIDFKRAALSQEVASLIAYFDAFFADSVKAICEKEPNVLRRDKHLSWGQAISFESIHDLRRYLIDSYCLDLGVKPIRERLETLDRTHKLDFALPDETLLVLHEGELVRHLILHNGGRVSHEYLKRTSVHGRALDELVPLDRAYAFELAQAATKAATALFSAIVQKFFKSDPVEMIGYPRIETSLGKRS